MSGLRPVVPHAQREVLRILVDRRRAIGQEHTYKVKQPHALKLELVPRGAQRDLSHLERVYARKNAARSVGDVNPVPDKGHFASWTGTAPIDASSGDNVRHRWSRGGNRKINRVLPIMAIVQLRNATEGRAYYDPKLAAGKTPNEAMRCLKRRLSDIVYRTVLDDLTPHAMRGPGGHSGNGSDSSATGSQPATGSSDTVTSRPRYRPPCQRKVS